MIVSNCVALLVLLPTVLTQTAAPSAPSVDLDIGRIVGKTETITQGSVKEFLGIPFAYPPVGNLRFTMPEPIRSLDVSPYDASYYRPHCPQMGAPLVDSSDRTEDEDCLYLNVFVPEGQQDQASGYAVMIWIYGGGWTQGAAEWYHGASLAATGNVIVITVNYRLGAFGFLSTDDDNAPGNFGLYDQHLAIQWVHQNIVAFGGDTNRVTIFGESAGAMGVCLQGLYEKNYGLFQRVIAESGAPTIPGFSLSEPRLPTAQFVAHNLNCPTDDSKEMIECLIDVPWMEFQQKLDELVSNPANIAILQFQPTVDGDIILTDYKDMFKTLHADKVPDELTFFRSLDFLSGFNAYEGGLILGWVQPDTENFEPSVDDMKTILIPTANYIIYQRDFPDNIKTAIVHEYTNWSDPFSFQSVRLQYTKLYGDAMFGVPAVHTALLHSMDTSRSTYMYHFMPASPERPPWTPSWLPGADHYEEVKYVFGQGYSTMTAWEEILSNKIMRYWTNFAKAGNPNSPVQVDEMWPSYNKSHQFYTELDKDMGAHSSKQFLIARETHFWLDVAPGLVEMTETGGTGPDDCIASGAGKLGSTVGLLITVVMLVACFNWF